MQALREIHNLTSNTLTIPIPTSFSYKKVEVIVLAVENQDEKENVNVWVDIDKIYEELEKSGRTFSDSAELIRADRGE
jgi:hypothetical protein